MSSALRFLAWRSAVNGWRVAREEMLKPWRLLVMVAALAWLVGLGHFGGAPSEPDPVQATNLGALSLVILTATSWLLGAGQGAVSVRGPWRALLLPAPVHRSSVLNLLLLRGQVAVLLNVAAFSLIGMRRAAPLESLERAAGFWILFTTLSLHHAIVASIRGSSGRWPWLRRAGMVVGLVLLLAIPFVSARSGGPWQQLQFSADGPARVLLSLFAIPVRPAVVAGTASWTTAIAMAMCLLLVHYLVLLSVGPATEPAGPPGARPGPPVVSLGRLGAGNAIAWKAMTASVRRAAFHTALVTACFTAVALAWLGTRDPGRAAFSGFLFLTWAPIALVSGPQFLPNGLRRDAPAWALLRTLPRRGHDWVLGAATGAGVVLALLVTALVALGLAATRGSAEIPLDEGMRLVMATSLALVIFPLAIGTYIAADWVALLVPLLSSGAQSREAATRLGSTLLATLLSLGVLLLAAIPAAALIGGALLLPLPPQGKVLAGGIVGATVLVVECVVASRLVGGMFERSTRGAA